MTAAQWPFLPEPPEPPGRPDHPGWPYPPERVVPRRAGPVMVPMVDAPADATTSRRVLLSGPLDAVTATCVAAELMELDGRSGDDVELVINSDGGALVDVVGLLDVIAVMRARVNTMGVGRTFGTAAALLASGTGSRRIGAHATVSLRCRREREQVVASADDVRRHLDELERVRRVVIEQLVRATGRSAAEVTEHLDDGPLLDRAGAAELGIIDRLEPR